MISVLIPFHNEKENLKELHKRIVKVLTKEGRDFEIVLVDDGSTDGSSAVIKDLSHVDLVTHKKKRGKGRALTSGFQASKGETIVFMDADLQDDPDDLPHFIKKIDEGYDFVNGWRRDRRDPFFKKLYSSIFNGFLLGVLLRSHFHDINCGFKAMRRSVLDEVVLYGDNYRFLPILADKEGFRTTEVVVHHHPRLHGKSKYGLFRVVSGFFDTLSTAFIYKFAEKPLQFFGLVGSLLFFIGFVITLYLLYERIFFGILLFRRPALTFGILFIIVGLQVVMTGIIGELVVYFNSRNNRKS